jgi:hypothetical protein
VTLPVEGERVTVFDEHGLPATVGIVARFQRLARFSRVRIESGERDRRLTLPAGGLFYVREVGASWEGLELGSRRARVPVLGRCVKVRPSRSPDDLIAVAKADRRRSLLALLTNSDIEERVLGRWTDDQVDAVLAVVRGPRTTGPMLTQQQQVDAFHEIDCDMDEDCTCRAPA